MNIGYFEDYSLLSERAAEVVVSELRDKPDMLLCAATGHSPEGLYRNLTRRKSAEPSLFRELRVVKLDEWHGIPAGDRGTCESYLRHNLLDPLGIDHSRYISFSPGSENPEQECRRIQSLLDSQDPIDLTVLGLGKNGHLGFNEPDHQLEPHCHVVKLTTESQQHSMMAANPQKPLFGLTLGMKDILASRKIILIVQGKGKDEAQSMLLSGKISTWCPASFLWLHPRVECLIMQRDRSEN